MDNVKGTIRSLRARTCPSCGGHLDATRYCYQTGACGRDWADVWRDRAALVSGRSRIITVRPILFDLLGVAS